MGGSRVVPWTVIVHGVTAEPVEARQVAESLMPLTITLAEVKARRSAMPPGVGKEVMSMTRKRRRVTFAPVLLTKRRLIDNVPLLVLGGAELVTFRTRFGTAAAACVAPSS